MADTENIVCIFAHPDDEAFGPSGIIAKWARKNNVFIICVTDGSHPNAGVGGLSKIRDKELNKSAEILGVKKVFFLGYTDGELRNNIYHKVAGDIEKILIKLKPKALLTFELRGVSGHIDHVFVSMVTSFLYRKLVFIRKIYYALMPKAISNEMREYFIFVPEGCERNNADYIEDVTEVWDKKIEAIKAHKSQKKDGDFVLKMINKLPKEELFWVSSK